MRSLLLVLAACTAADAVMLHRGRLSSPATSTLRRLRGGGSGEVELLVTEEDLDVVLEEAGDRLVVVDFFAEWCGPCKQLAPKLDALAEKAGGKVLFYKIDVDQSRELAAEKEVSSMPTILFYRNGELVNKVVGADVQAITREVMNACRPAIMRLLSSEKLLVALAGIYMVPYVILPALA